MSKRKILTNEEKKKLIKLTTDGLKPLHNENATVEELEKVRSNLDEIISLVDSALSPQDKK